MNTVKDESMQKPVNKRYKSLDFANIAKSLRLNNS